MMRKRKQKKMGKENGFLIGLFSKVAPVELLICGGEYHETPAEKRASQDPAACGFREEAWAFVRGKRVVFAPTG
jgi:hypothetical protein